MGATSGFTERESHVGILVVDNQVLDGSKVTVILVKA